MSANELRQAAEILRGRANGSVKGPWVAGRHGRVSQAMKPALLLAVADCYPTGGSDHQQRQADYIATMHPGVGLALADWLEYVSDRAKARTGRNYSYAVRMARLINGGE